MTQPITTTEQAVAVLNEKKWRHFDTWRPSPKFSIGAWDERFNRWGPSYAEKDAIAIANSIVLAAALRARDEQIATLKTELDQYQREGIESAFPNLLGRIDELQEQLQAKDERIKELEAEIEALKEELGDLGFER